MITIEKMSFLEYLIAFARYNTIMSERCVSEAGKTGLLYCARNGKEYVGYICAVSDSEVLRIAYALTVPEYRGQGIFTALVRHIIDNTPKNVRVNILQKHGSHDAVVSVCKKLGFVPGEQLTVFTCRAGNDSDWHGFMNGKGTKMCELLRRRGYRTISFADADSEIIAQIRYSHQSDYGSTFETAPFLDDPARQMSPDMSFAAVKDGKLAAYTLVSRQSETKVIFEQITDSVQERGGGAIILPFAAAMEKFFEYGCTVSSYAMYGSNTQANAFRRKLLSRFDTTESVSENYYYMRT